MSCRISSITHKPGCGVSAMESCTGVTHSKHCGGGGGCVCVWGGGVLNYIRCHCIIEARGPFLLH